MLENHVPTLETCKRLKEAGFPQDTYFNWAREWNKPSNHSDRRLVTGWLLITRNEGRTVGTKIERVAAPIMTEIGYELDKITVFDRDVWVDNLMIFHTNDENLAEAVALVWLKFNENKEAA